VSRFPIFAVSASRFHKKPEAARQIDFGWSIRKWDKGVLSLVTNIGVVDRTIARRSGS
jgi:hypothetical protein